MAEIEDNDDDGATPDRAIEGGPFWTVAELLERVTDYPATPLGPSLTSDQILIIVSVLCRDRRVRSIGRPCEEAGHPQTKWWRSIPDHEWSDLIFSLPPRGAPHPGDVCWISMGQRAYTSVQFSEPDLMREWLSAVFARPRQKYSADVEIPPPPSSVDRHGPIDMPAGNPGAAGSPNVPRPRRASETEIRNVLDTLYDNMFSGPPPDRRAAIRWAPRLLANQHLRADPGELERIIDEPRYASRRRSRGRPPRT